MATQQDRQTTLMSRFVTYTHEARAKEEGPGRSDHRLSPLPANAIGTGAERDRERAATVRKSGVCNSEPPGGGRNKVLPPDRGGLPGRLMASGHTECDGGLGRARPGGRARRRRAHH
jgi:hypothetical protein